LLIITIPFHNFIVIVPPLQDCYFFLSCLSIPPNTSAVYALLRRKRETGSIEPGYKGKCGRPSKLTQEQWNAMEALVNQHPDITLEEVQQKLDLPIKKSQISNLLHKMGFRLKKDDSCLRTKAA